MNVGVYESHIHIYMDLEVVPLFAIVNNATMHLSEHIFHNLFKLYGVYSPEVELWDHMVDRHIYASVLKLLLQATYTGWIIPS